MKTTPRALIENIYGYRLSKTFAPTLGDWIQLRAALKTLTPREEKVLQLTYWAGYTYAKIGTMTLSAVDGKRLTAERVKQIHDKALRKLRHPHRRGYVLPATVFHFDPHATLNASWRSRKDLAVLSS